MPADADVGELDRSARLASALCPSAATACMNATARRRSTPRSNEMRSILLILQPLDQLGHAGAGLRASACPATTSSLPTMPIAIDALQRVQGLQDRDQPFDVAADQRMIRRVQLRGTHAGGEPAEQLVVLGDAALDVGHVQSLIPNH